MRVPVLIVFMLVTGIAVAGLSVAAGVDAGMIVLRVIGTLVVVQVVYFAAVLLFSAHARRSGDTTVKKSPAAIKRPSSR